MNSPSDPQGGASTPTVATSAFPVVAREDISEVTFLLEISHPLMARAARPGQFVIVMSHAEGERIPLTIADFDSDRGTVTLVIQAVGKSTLEMQRDCRVGTTLYGIAGPLGIPTEIRGEGTRSCATSSRPSSTPSWPTRRRGSPRNGSPAPSAVSSATSWTPPRSPGCSPTTAPASPSPTRVATGSGASSRC
jgi:hypothetical protein